MDKTKQQHSAYYDKLHSDPVARVPYRRSFYYPLFSAAIDCLVAAQVRSVLEVGCGNGTLAEMLMARASLAYRGFDSSPVAVKAAGERTGQPDRFFIGDALDPASYEGKFDGIICCEVLEHITGDLDAIRLWPVGAYCVCSVPDFDYESHVRYFSDADSVHARYGDLIDIESIRRIGKPPLRGLTPIEYLRKLSRARDNPKKFLGLLGINHFKYLSGWFLFVGKRRPTPANCLSN